MFFSVARWDVYNPRALGRLSRRRGLFLVRWRYVMLLESIRCCFLERTGFKMVNSVRILSFWSPV